MGDTIGEALETITEELPENFEIVIVDQSNDGSKEIIDEFASNSKIQFKKIYFDRPLGVARPRNIAVREATGDIVMTHIDADDWYDSRYFPALVELYMILKEKIGSDFFFCGPNTNISSKQFMIENYTLSSAPIGANEMEYTWRAYRNGDYVGLKLDENKMTGRIKLSDRKDIASRIKRTYRRCLGMYRIGYGTRRIIEQDIVLGRWSLVSKLYRAAILPIVWLHSLFVPNICDAPIKGETLDEIISQSTYTLKELKEEYDIKREIALDRLVNKNI
jgi:glycosyltransferase involved in cell wall biosynthesis